MMHKISHRLSRVELQLMREIVALLKNDIQDPRLKNTVVITRVKMSPDLRHASIFFTESVMKNSQLDKKKLVMLSQALNHSVSYLRRRISETLRLRVVPTLFFTHDQFFEEAEALVSLIDSLPVSSGTT